MWRQRWVEEVGVVELTKQRASCTKFTVFRVCVANKSRKNFKILYCNELKCDFFSFEASLDSSDCQR